MFALITFATDFIATDCDGKEGACPLGVFALTLSAFTIVLAWNAVFSAIKKLTLGERIAYGAFTVTLAVDSTASFFGDSGYVLKNCNR